MINQENKQDRYSEPVENEPTNLDEKFQAEKPFPVEEENSVEQKEVDSTQDSSLEQTSEKVNGKANQLKNMDKKSQIKALCDLALEKGPDFAIEVAKSLDSAYVLDEFHDALVDELRKSLIEKGDLKQL
ncbi:MAG: hypothetical protein ABIC36_03880 [bacterium]